MAMAASILACGGDDNPAPTATTAEVTSSATAAAGIGATETPIAPTATPTPEPGEVVFAFDPLMDAGQQAIVRGGVDHAVRYIEAEAGLPAVDVIVYAYVLPARLLQAIDSRGVLLPVPPEIVASRLQVTASEAFPGMMIIDPTSRPWLLIDDLNHFRIAAHEYFHVVQFHLMGEELSREVFTAPIGADRPEGANWLFEGSAEYVSWKALEAAGIGSLDDYIAAHPLADDADLRAFETPLGYSTSDNASLVLPLAGVRFLMADGEPDRLLNFYRLLGRGVPWRQAFETTFGRSIDAFYAEFAASLRP